MGMVPRSGTSIRRVVCFQAGQKMPMRPCASCRSPGSTRMPNFGEIPGGPAIDPPRIPHLVLLGPLNTNNVKNDVKIITNNFPPVPLYTCNSARTPCNWRLPFRRRKAMHKMPWTLVNAKVVVGLGRRGVSSVSFATGSGKCDWVWWDWGPSNVLIMFYSTFSLFHNFYKPEPVTNYKVVRYGKDYSLATKLKM